MSIVALAVRRRRRAQPIGDGLDRVGVPVGPKAFPGRRRLTGVDTVGASRSEYVVALLSTGAATILPRRR